MSKDNATVELDACLEAALARTTEPRARIVLQMMAASIDTSKLVPLLQQLEKRPAGAPEHDVFKFENLVSQMERAVQQAMALDLDRSGALKILGMGQDTCATLFCAKTLGHDVIAACRNTFVGNWLARLYQLPLFEPKSRNDLPQGPFDLVLAVGSPGLGTKRGWADFVVPLDSRLTESGRIFVALSKEPNAKASYFPEIVIAKLAALGARVSSKELFVLLGKPLIAKFAPGALNDAAAAAPRLPQQTTIAELDEDEEHTIAPPRQLARGFWPMKMTFVFAGGLVILLGLLAVTWAGL